MKKKLLILAFALPILGFSQLFNFNTTGDKQGWNTTNANNAASVVSGGNYTIVKATSNNPYLSYSGTIDATTKKYLRISMRNLSGFDKFNFRSDGSTAATANIGPFALPTYEGTSGIFKDYYVDLSVASLTDWSSATETAMQIRFATALTPAVGETIEINEIEFLDSIDKHEYNFNYAEQWTPLDGTTAVSSGKLVLTPTGPAAKITQDVLTADATNNKYVHIFYKNNSPSNNQFRFQFKYSGDSYVAFKGKNQNISSAMSAVEETVIDMTTVAEWTGRVKNLQIIVRNTNNANNSSTDGTMEFDRIVINNSNSSLSADNINQSKKLLKVFVSDNKLNFINSTVKNVTIYNANGQLVKNSAVQNNMTDVSNLKQGVYLIKAISLDNSETIVKFIKK